MINIEGIPIVAARLRAAEKKKRRKSRRAALKGRRIAKEGEVRKAAA